jgi:hypothetical protein
VSSSPPPDAPETGPSETGAASAGPGTKWPRWRVSMMIGALILLAAAILDATVELARPVYVVIFFAGYIFLAYGFFTALGARNEAAKKKK